MYMLLELTKTPDASEYILLTICPLRCQDEWGQVWMSEDHHCMIYLHALLVSCSSLSAFVTPLGASGDVFGALEFRHNLGMFEDLIVSAGSLEWLYWSFWDFIVDQSCSRVWSSHDMERQKVWPTFLTWIEPFGWNFCSWLIIQKSSKSLSLSSSSGVRTVVVSCSAWLSFLVSDEPMLEAWIIQVKKIPSAPRTGLVGPLSLGDSVVTKLYKVHANPFHNLDIT